MTGLGLCAMAVMITACATVMQGKRQDFSIASTPPGARVMVDGGEVGTTPFVAALRRKDKHLIRVELEGYQPFELSVARKTSGWVWGNLLLGGIPGLAIDAITGSMYKLKPEQVQATLTQSTAAIDQQRDLVLVTVVLRPDPGWEQIGTLTRQRSE